MPKLLKLISEAQVQIASHQERRIKPMTLLLMQVLPTLTILSGKRSPPNP
jgi:hypothetical protein